MKKLLILLVLSGLTSLASAEVININFTTSQGDNPNIRLEGIDSSLAIAPIPYQGSTWNDVMDGTVWRSGVNLKDSTGNKTKVTLKVASNSEDKGKGNIFGYSSIIGPDAGDDVIDNYLAVNQTKQLTSGITLSFDGLDPEANYNFTFIAQGDKEGQGATFILNGKTRATDGKGPYKAFARGVNFVTFSKVKAPTGELDVIVKAGPNDPYIIALNGVQIVKAGS